MLKFTGFVVFINFPTQMPLELSFVIPLTVILAGIIAVFFWAQSGRKQAQIEEAARKQTAAAPAANAPARERKKWSANVHQVNPTLGHPNQPRKIQALNPFTFSLEQYVLNFHAG
jgi:uncharacterized protein (UPF0333 family)